MRKYDLVSEIEKFQLRFKLPPEKALYLMEDAISDACDYCNREEPVQGMATAIRDLATIRYNQEGNEGETGRSEGGVSQSFEEGIPKRIRSSLNRYRLGGWGRLG